MTTARDVFARTATARVYVSLQQHHKRTGLQGMAWRRLVGSGSLKLRTLSIVNADSHLCPSSTAPACCRSPPEKYLGNAKRPGIPRSVVSVMTITVRCNRPNSGSWFVRGIAGGGSLPAVVLARPDRRVIVAPPAPVRWDALSMTHPFHVDVALTLVVVQHESGDDLAQIGGGTAVTATERRKERKEGGERGRGTAARACVALPVVDDHIVLVRGVVVQPGQQLCPAPRRGGRPFHSTMR